MLSPAIIAWLKFFLCAALIAVAGTRLSRYGDIIAEKTSLLLSLYLLNALFLYLYGG